MSQSETADQASSEGLESRIERLEKAIAAFVGIMNVYDNTLPVTPMYQNVEACVAIMNERTKPSPDAPRCIAKCVHQIHGHCASSGGMRLMENGTCGGFQDRTNVVWRVDVDVPVKKTKGRS